jgi:DHA1 family bicyclomycin/chloramphenicol resistance-like MFS transporter
MKHTESKTFIIWILGALATITPIAIDLYLPAFSNIADYFNTTTAKISLSVTSYFIGMAIGQILYGPLLDRFGRKPPLYAGLSVFIITSIACAQSQSDTMLVVLRFIQALGGSVAWVAAVTMVRDFFPVHESAKIFSLLILIIGVSPLLAPTLGGFIATTLGWKAIFFISGGVAFLILLVVIVFLPQRHLPDKTISLKPGPILNTFSEIVRQPQFLTYVLAGAFSFCTLFIYVAGSPVIFMEIYDVSPQVYGGIFALLSVGFIGASQLNIFLTKKTGSEKIFKISLIIQVLAGALFLAGTLFSILNVYSTLVLFFICLSCVGLINPNATALALAPISRNLGSASSLLGFLQLGIAALASAGVGLFDSHEMLPIVALMLVTSLVALIILSIGRKVIGRALVLTNETDTPVSH